MELSIEELIKENESNKEILIIAQNEAMEAQAERDKYKEALEYIREVLTNEYYVDTVKAIHKIDEVLK